MRIEQKDKCRKRNIIIKMIPEEKEEKKIEKEKINK